AAQIIDAGGEVEDESVVISRTVSTAGKSRVLVGGVVSSAAAVSSFANSLVEIHAQTSSSKLTKPGVARELLDRFAGLELEPYQEIFEQYQQMKQRIIDLKEQLSQADRQIAELSELADQFAKLNPKSGELAEIENELEKLGSVELLNQAVSSALNLFENEDLSAVNMLQQIRKSLDQVNGKDKQLDQITERYTESLLNLQDISSDLTSYLSQLEADPNRFEKLQERKSSLNSLLKRYGKGSDKEAAFEQLLLDGKNAKERIADLSGGDERVAELEKQAQSLFKQLQEKAIAISNSRKESGAKLSAQVTEEVRGLSMPNASFVIDQVVADSENPRSYTSTG
ncbi:MAG: hypothetical protein EBY71_04540, partial [Actinobacteria bacterium]|nr:hypothetical protein [Actinomycetota bacterium]